MSEIEAFTIAATDEQLADLRQRLHNTRWPEAELVEDWTEEWEFQLRITDSLGTPIRSAALPTKPAS